LKMQKSSLPHIYGWVGAPFFLTLKRLGCFLCL
jgi:hypothetical protein